MRELIKIAKEKARIRNIIVAPGFIFGVSRKILCARTGIDDTTMKRLLHLIAGLGLIKRLRVDEAAHIDEYYGELGIAAQQYRLDALYKNDIRYRWNLFIESGIDIWHEELTIEKVEEIMEIDEVDTIATRPEALDINDVLREEGRRIRRKRNRMGPGHIEKDEKDSTYSIDKNTGLIRDIIRSFTLKQKLDLLNSEIHFIDRKKYEK